MNWKASLIGAVLVAGSGLVVGAAIGGKKTTKFVTVAAPAPAAATAPAATTSGTTSTETTSSTQTATTGESPPESGGREEYLAEYLGRQDSEQLSQDAANVSLSNEPSKQELQGQTYQQAVAFAIDGSSDSNASFQVPTPGFSRLTSKAAGLEINTNAETSYKLTVYKNNDSSPNSVVLYQASFHGPSEVHKMDFSLQGATDVLFVWARQGSTSYGQDVFILADPVLTR